ncbi:ATF7 factor, partial [Regulus satrapa]|nr:ATF7 factor [Regulus satrapa]
GALDMSLPSTPDIKIKEEEPVEVDSSPPDSPASRPRSPQHKDKELPSKPVILSTPTPTIVRPGSLPLHLGYDPLHPTLPSPTSVITQAPPANRQLGAGNCPGLERLRIVPGLEQLRIVPGLEWLRIVLGWNGSGLSWGGTAQDCPRAGNCPGLEWLRRLKASLAASSSLNGGGLAAGSASTMVSARPEQSQILVQHPDAPSPAQPQVCAAATALLLHCCCCAAAPGVGLGVLGLPGLGKEEKTSQRPSRFAERVKTWIFRCRCGTEANEVTLLRNEVAQLKQLLLAHKDCPVTALQKKTQGYLGE